ncbi:MAG: hypothetical protein ABIA04_16145 [Pseudomonadota bacterium]
MNDLLNKFRIYLKETLSLDVIFKKQTRPKALPFFLHDLYDFYEIEILSKFYIIMLLKNNNEYTPAMIYKHMQIIQKHLDNDLIFVGSHISSHNRKRLIKYKVPFVVPGNQMYLPYLQIDLREHFLKAKVKRNYFSPSTQLVLLYIFNKKIKGPITPTMLSQKLGYSCMSMTRAFNEIESNGLGEIDIIGKERRMSFKITRKKLWKKALPYLKTPVKAEVWIKSEPKTLPVLVSSLTALSKYSMLASPKQQVFAIGKNDWLINKNKVLKIKSEFPDEAIAKIEVWYYSPFLFSDNGSIDKFSLYLCLKDVKGERIEQALANMMKEIKW